MTKTPVVAMGGALLAMTLGLWAGTQELKPWRHGAIGSKGDAGFSLMVSKHSFAEKQGSKVEIVTSRMTRSRARALLSGDLD